MSTIEQNSSKRPDVYIVTLVVMVITIGLMITYFAMEEYRVNQDKMKGRFKAETERIENSLVNIIEHTEFMMKIIIMQITPNHKNLNHINSILSKYSVNPNLNNILSWTSFVWLDKDLIKRVDSVSGIVLKPSSHAYRDFLQLSKVNPEIMHLGTPILGFNGQKYIIPASIGATNDKNYIGALATGFDLLKLGHMLSRSIKEQNMYFALVDKNLNIICHSPSSEDNSGQTIDIEEFKNFISRNNINFANLSNISEIDLVSSGSNHYLHKFNKYPFALYLHYNNQAVTESFWREIAMRVTEVGIISFVALILVFYVYKREKILRNKAEVASRIALNASQAKTDFLAYTAHELRSPWALSLLALEMMTTRVFGKLNEKYLEYIKNIHQASSELLEFINDLLDEMRIEEGNFKVAFAPVNVENLLRRSIRLNMMHYSYKITVEMKIAKNLPTLISDHRRLLQVFNNIISNAVKYSPENTTLEVIVKMRKKQMIIIFRDQGYGMDARELEISLAKYGVIKRDETVTNAIGLGLPLVKHLLEALGAEFNINSSLGRGTKITIIFPENKIDYGKIVVDDSKKSS